MQPWVCSNTKSNLVSAVSWDNLIHSDLNLNYYIGQAIPICRSAIESNTDNLKIEFECVHMSLAWLAFCFAFFSLLFYNGFIMIPK